MLSAIEGRIESMSGIASIVNSCNRSPAEVARRLTAAAGRPCSRQNVQHWVRKGYVPHTWAPVAAKEFGVPLPELNAAVYPRDQVA